MATSITKSRLIFWFEKFFWFISSENYMVIGGRDKIQAQLIIRRYMLPEDIFVHTDVPGSSCFVIKNPSGGPVPPKTVNEAGSMAVCFSSAWNIHVITNAWWVNGNQVIKLNPVSGADQFYNITGQKNYLLPGQLAVGFGFIFYIDESCIEQHAGERQVKFIEAEEVKPSFVEETPSCAESQNSSEETAQLLLDEGESVLNQDFIVDDSSSSSDEDSDDENGEEGHNNPLDSNSDECDESAQEVEDAEDEKNIPDEDSENLNAQTVESKEEEIEELKPSQENETSAQIPISKGKKGKLKNTNEREEAKKKQKEVDSNVLKRGQRSKLKKIKEKYRDQDEEEKQLRMAILQSAGSRKENSKKSLKQAREQQALEKRNKRIPKIPHKKPKENNEEEVEEPDIPVDTDLSMLNRLTGLPHAEDKIIFALPVVAPYNTLVGYKYRVKMIPGTSKRGKSARNALNIFLNSKETNEKEKAFMKSVNDQVLCRDLPGKVKLSVGQVTAKLKKKR